MLKYCESIYQTKRFKTRQVMVGHVGVGGDNPVRIQSMTTSNTRDIEATIEQVIRLADAGCEIVRMTVQGMKEADACEAIKNGLLQRGYQTPLVADIHFFPPAALRVIDFVDKVRINPGNFIDKRASFKTIEYDDQSYAEELEKIEEKFTPLVEKCKRLKKAMRIGTNHGSLSDRIMNRYGDSPRGMIESAFEFARVCRKLDFHDFIFSMKSSNPQVMMQAYRLLAAEMLKLEWDYPLHLGVTEAGEGEDGRIKSAMGIGSLLLDGLGDTIRVSLTEDAWNEIDPCKRLIGIAKSYQAFHREPFTETHRNIEEIKRREVVLPSHISFHRDGSVLLKTSAAEIQQEQFYQQIGCAGEFNRPKLKRTSADALLIADTGKDKAVETKLKGLRSIGISTFGASNAKSMDDIPLLSLHDLITQEKQKRFSVTTQKETLPKTYALLISNESSADWNYITTFKPAIIFLSPREDRLHYSRHFFEWLQSQNLPLPVILNFKYTCSQEQLIIEAAAECGALLCDGLGEGLLIEANQEPAFIRFLSFNLLQAARMRTSKTEFISCPSCGRTLFDLQNVSKRIRERTAHLPGVKIAIMGCIVNGPGEMADADFGYVGSKPGMIDLYVGKNCVEKEISFAEADDRLIDLIKRHNRWIEPQAEGKDGN